jgi:hypothetical protein
MPLQNVLASDYFNGARVILNSECRSGISPGSCHKPPLSHCKNSFSRLVLILILLYIMRTTITKLHGALDYLVASGLLLPWMFDYNSRSGDTWILATIGFIIFLYSILTDYHAGAIAMIPVRVHMIFDILAGIFLLFLPAIFTLEHYPIYWPMIMGATLLVMASLFSLKAYRNRPKDYNITQPV